MKISLSIVAFLGLRISVECVIFNCDYRVVAWSYIGNAYTCYVKDAIISDDERILTEVTGIHQINKTDLDVLTLTLYKVNCPFIPKNIDRIFPNLEGLQFQYANTSTIASSDLRPFPQLKVLLFRSNGLRFLDADLFRYNPNIEWIDFFDNEIKFVGFNLLDGMTKLADVYFSLNTCIDRMVTKPSEIPDVKTELLYNCPSPTSFHVIESEILDGALFEKIVYAQIGIQVNPLEAKVKELENRIEKLEKQICGQLADIQRQLINTSSINQA